MDEKQKRHLEILRQKGLLNPPERSEAHQKALEAIQELSEMERVSLCRELQEPVKNDNLKSYKSKTPEERLEILKSLCNSLNIKNDEALNEFIQYWKAEPSSYIANKDKHKITTGKELTDWYVEVRKMCTKDESGKHLMDVKPRFFDWILKGQLSYINSDQRKKLAEEKKLALEVCNVKNLFDDKKKAAERRKKHKEFIEPDYMFDFYNKPYFRLTQIIEKRFKLEQLKMNLSYLQGLRPFAQDIIEEALFCFGNDLRELFLKINFDEDQNAVEHMILKCLKEKNYCPKPKSHRLRVILEVYQEFSKKPYKVSRDTVAYISHLLSPGCKMSTVQKRN
jgi:hypothetical protein